MVHWLVFIKPLKIDAMFHLYKFSKTHEGARKNNINGGKNTNFKSKNSSLLHAVLGGIGFLNTKKKGQETQKKTNLECP